MHTAFKLQARAVDDFVQLFYATAGDKKPYVKTSYTPKFQVFNVTGLGEFVQVGDNIFR